MPYRARRSRRPDKLGNDARPGEPQAPDKMDNQQVLGFGINEYGQPENRLKAMACHERPQARLESFGVSALSDTELLAIVLGNGTRGNDVVSLASQLIGEAGSLAKLASWRERDFEQLQGIGRVKAAQLVAMMEVGRRTMAHNTEEAPILNRADIVARYLHPMAASLEVEKFWTVLLNRKNRLLKLVEITSGTATSALAHPREVFRAAIRESACALVCVHNHPSGDPAPSSADIQITHLLREAAKTVEITLVDHVIVGRPGADPSGRGYYSFRESGLM